VQQLAWHFDHPAELAPPEPGGAARPKRVLIPGAGGAGLALVKLAIELLDGTAAHLDQLGVVRPTGPAIVLHRSTTPFPVVIK
jgi:hypothetical protein